MEESRLRKVPLFAGLTRRELGRVARVTDEVTVAPGTRLVNEGDFAYEFFLIEDGSAEVVRDVAHLADLGPGDFFGEMGAMTDAQRNATVTATSPLRAIVMTARDFRTIALELPEVAERIRTTVRQRTSELVS
jgi:CRP/FNR family cyclic AMP-dependent transcriptional regulator